jgi:hypothetical protein
MTASNNFNEQVREFYQQAADCARQADAQNDPKVKQQFLELRRLWLYWRSVASSIKPNRVTRPPLPAALVLSVPGNPLIGLPLASRTPILVWGDAAGSPWVRTKTLLGLSEPA